MTIKPNHKISHYRPDIDGLRALAIILVVLYHVFPNIVKGGFVGVDVFFVISGFLISGIILRELDSEKFSFLSFYVRRIKRILPVLMVVIVTSLFLGWLFLLPKEFKELGKHIAGGVGFVANFTLWSDAGYFDALPELKPLLHLWSLGVEEQFYLLWPLILFVVWRIFPPSINHFKVMTYLVITSLLFSFVSNISLITSKPDAVFYFPFTRFWELFIGAALCIVLIRHPHNVSLKNHANLLSIMGIVLILTAVLSIDKNSVFPGWWAILPTIGTALIIAGGPHAWLNSKIFSNDMAVGIGLISYPLYLWHWPLLSFISIKIGALSYDLDKVAVLISSFLLAWLSYKYVETPIRRRKSGKPVILILLGFSLILGLLGIAIYKLDGIPSRISTITDNKQMPAEIQEMLNPDFGGYLAKNWREHDCFLTSGEGPERYSEECIEHASDPVVFLWGDSHAAALYFGLKTYQQKKNFSIAQHTASACPPVINWDGAINKLCRSINSHNITLIKQTKPDIVILEAAWYWSEYDWKLVVETINELKKIGIRRIVLAGPVPKWQDRVPNVIVDYYRNYKKFPPIYTAFGIDVKEIAKIDRQLEALALEQKIAYVSIFNTLCSQSGCMLSIGSDVRNISSLDHAHLSEFASKFVVEAASVDIFGDM